MSPRIKISLAFPELFQNWKAREELGPVESPKELERAQERRNSIQDAYDWIEETIRAADRWDAHWSLIRIECPYTMAELRELGKLPRYEGVRACGKLVSVPVIHDEICNFLWTKLADAERRPDSQRNDEETRAEEVPRIKTEAVLAHLNDWFRFDRRPASAPEKESDKGKGKGKGKGRETDDSRPRSPTPSAQQQDPIPHPPGSSRRTSRRKSSDASQACYFCRRTSNNEQPAVPDGIRAEALHATRGRTVGSRRSRSRGDSRSRDPDGPNPNSDRPRPRPLSQGRLPTPPIAFFRDSRSPSHVDSLVWRRDDASVSTISSSASCRSTPAGLGPRRTSSLTERLGSAVGELGKSVVNLLAESFPHGYGLHEHSGRPTSIHSV